MSKKLRSLMIFFILAILFILCSALFIKTFNTTERVIENHIKYTDMHNIKKLSRTITDEIDNNYLKYIDNIETMRLISMELHTEDNYYNIYLNGGKGSLRKDLSRDDVKIYTVDYYIKYKDDNKSVEGSGEHSKIYTLIKEEDTNRWIIDEIGY